MILGIDVSGWNTNLDWDKLAAGGVKYAIVKLTQATYSVTRLAEQHIKNARSVGMEVAAYHWSDPLYNDQMQADFFAKYLDLYDIGLGLIDAEQYWEDWDQFYKKNVTKFLPPNRISQNAYNVMMAIRKKGFNSDPYSRRTFIDSYASPMWNWIKPQKNWWAHYPYAIGRLYATWEQFKPGGTHFPRINQPTLPPGTNWQLWQFSGDKFILPGTGDSPIDLNFFPGTMNDLVTWFRSTTIDKPIDQPIEEAEVEDMVRLIVRTNDLRIREKPDTAATTKVLGWRKKDSMVIAKEIKVVNPRSVWALDEKGWSAIVHGDLIYMT